MGKKDSKAKRAAMRDLGRNDLFIVSLAPQKLSEKLDLSFFAFGSESHPGIFRRLREECDF